MHEELKISYLVLLYTRICGLMNTVQCFNSITFNILKISLKIMHKEFTKPYLMLLCICSLMNT